MEYIVSDINNNRLTFDFSYQQLKEEYNKIMDLDEKIFFKQLPKILHLVCIISFLKEIPAYILLSDEGLIHEISHCLDKTIEKNTETFEKLKNLLKILELN